MAKAHFEHGSVDFRSISLHQNIDFFLSDYEKSVLKFIKEWYNEKKEWQLFTSGSTGKPKSILLKRHLIAYSAQQTIEALRLSRQSSSLLSINAGFVGGKMMIARSLINDMDLIVKEPSTKSLLDLPDHLPIGFAAFVPLQIVSFLSDKNQKEAFNKIKKVIIGGAPLDKNTEKSLDEYKTLCWQTYGMTETYSHVALRQLNGKDRSDRFTATGDVLFTVDDDNRLIITGTITEGIPLLTNDIVKLYDEKTFQWKGRYDHVINTGGVKIFPETLEQKISQLSGEIGSGQSFFIAALPDKKLGEKLVLYIEGEVDTGKLTRVLKDGLSKYEFPREIILKNRFIYTTTGKINRKASQKS